MPNKTPGFTRIKSDRALFQDIDVKNPMEEALKKRRKDMAMKKGLSSNEVDELGNPVPKPLEENDDL